MGPIEAKPAGGRQAAGRGTVRKRRTGGGPANVKCVRNGVYFGFWVPFESVWVPGGMQMKLGGYKGTQMESRFGVF